MAVLQRRSVSVARRRMAAVFLLLLALALGALDAPRFWNERVPAFLRLGGRLAEPYRLGLDLQGGTHLVYQADVSALASSDRSEAMQGLRDVIERRVNLFGVTEPVVQVNRAGDDWRLIVELAGVKDIRQAIQLIGETPFLEFREPRDASTTAAILEAQKRGERLNEDPYFIPATLTGRYLKRAELQFDPNTNEPIIGVEFTSDGAKLFQEITKRNVGKPLGIYLDGIPRSAPIVQQEITGGKAVITGHFTLDEAKSIVRDLNSGSLPVPIALISQQSVEASLGFASLEASLRAGLIGFLIVGLFMILWYRLPGVLAVLALSVYASIVLAFFKFIPVTLSVAGIAGFILSVGMAVDANILIFERLKEELHYGKALSDAIEEGFQRAWTSIRDSNVSSLITAAILYYMGTSVVQGFALTLAIGIIVSMFTALTVTRTLLFATLRPAASKFWYLSGLTRSGA